MILAAIDSRVLTALVVAGGLAIFGLLLLVTAAGELRGRRKAKVPPAFRPAASDEQLERGVLERYQLWGVVSVIFMALWLPAYWLYQPTFLENRRAQIHHFDTFGHESAAERSGGSQLYEDFCATCHGANGEGGVRPYVIDDRQVTYAEPPLRMIYARYKASGRSDDEVERILRDAIERGRPGTPMPTWGFEFGGPMNSYQIDNLIEFIKTIQIEPEELPVPDDPKDGAAIFDANCAICHGDDGQGGVGPDLTVAFERFSRQALFDTIHDGRLNVNRPSMPTFAYLGDDAINALLDFIQSIQRGES